MSAARFTMNLQSNRLVESLISGYYVRVLQGFAIDFRFDDYGR